MTEVPISPEEGDRLAITGGGERAAFTVVVAPAATEIPVMSCVKYPAAETLTSYVPATRLAIE